METLALLASLIGVWSGQYELYLRPDAKPLQSHSVLTVERMGKSSYFIVRLTWEYKSEKKESLFLIGINGEKVEAVWADTWHMAPFPMTCKGIFDHKKRTLEFLGSYATGPDTPDWFWRTQFIFSGDSIVMKAYNITPSGESMLAVDALYTIKQK